jgi:uncharacterized membrane protein
MTDIQLYFGITMVLLVVFIIWLESTTNKSNRKKDDK